MRILAVTNMYPTPLRPVSGTFVKTQIEGLERIGVNVDVMFVDRALRGMQAYLAIGQEVRSRLSQGQPDLVHVMYGGVLADEVTRSVQNRPTVVSFCGSDLLGEHLSGPLRRVLSEYGVRASCRAASRASAIVVKSRNLYDALPHTVDRSKVRIIPNGVDLELFRPLDRVACRQRLGWPHDRLNVLFPTNVGDPRKRFGLARAAVETARQRGIPLEIHQLRDITHNEVPIWLNASDVLLLTSLHEGSPNVVKEALACNLPVISVDVGDVGERLNGIEGCHLASSDPNDLATKLSLVYFGSRTVAGRARMNELSLERIAVKLKHVYESLVRSPASEIIACSAPHPSTNDPDVSRGRRWLQP